MTPTPVGMRCPECAKQRTKVMRMREMTTVPRVTYALIAINVVAFLSEGRLTVSGGESRHDVYHEGALLGSNPLPEWAHQGVAHGEYWRIVTSGFLHENLLHIGFNMYLLYILGQILEPALGSFKFAVIYGVSLLTGSLGALLVTPHSPTVGASGAVFGLMGAAAVEARARKIPALQSWVGGLILINLIFSFTISGISWGGHVGGLIGGTLTALALQLGDRYRSQALALAGCAAIAVASVAGCVATSKSSEVESAGSSPLTLVNPPS
jgi:membrane associated rhomboid family serine protease